MMAQLKSFRYLEPEIQQDESQDDSSSANSSSISTVVGGNLTSDSSQADLPQPQQQPKRHKQRPKASCAVVQVDDESTTLSSSEECQLAQHDIIEEEDETNASGSPASSSARSPSAQVSQVRVSAPSPLSPLQQRLMGRQQVAASSPMLGRGQVTPASRASRQPDSVSQYSFGQRNAPSGNHFEIHWSSINLVARKTKLPRYVTENPFYRAFRGEKEPPTPCYSPPLVHRSFAEGQKLDAGLKPQEQPRSEASDCSEGRPILTNISGSVFSGQLTAVLGPSGVGKSMLLNSLTGRNTLDGTGRVSLIGGGSTKRLSVVTVPQNDVLPDKLTALEDLRFTSRLKNTQRDFDHEHNIRRIVRLLQMEKFLHTRIDKMSGGEARRLSIGRELLASPDIMILDEPTSGLDANTCKKIIGALRDIVEHSDNFLGRPMAIIVTIHQPQQEVLNLFHRLYVLARSGAGARAIYEGPPSSMLPSFLELSSLTQVTDVGQLNENPAIVALELASGEYGPDVIAELALAHELQVSESQDLAGQSPYLSPSSLRSIHRSPVSVTPRLSQVQRTPRVMRVTDSPKVRAAAFDSPKVRGAAFDSPKVRGPAFDRISNITTNSYASTYDGDLPEPTGRLKVDKRLRRSVVMKGDFVRHTLVLMQRCWILTVRDLFLMGIRILGYLLVAGGTVQIFSHALDPNQHQCPVYESSVDDIIGYVYTLKERLLSMQDNVKQSSSTHLFFFHLILCLTMVTSALTGLVFPFQMRMFMREYKNGWYSPASFITSCTLAELPVDVIGPSITLLIVYPLCGQPSSPYHWRMFAYIALMILASMICKSQAQIVGAFLMESVENSVFLSCVMVTPPALLSGIAVRVQSMSWPLQVLSAGSFLRYTFEGMLAVRYGYGLCPCDKDLVNGYPIETTANALPPQLANMARGFLDLYSNNTEPVIDGPAGVNSTALSGFKSPVADDDPDGDHPNLFLKFIRLLTSAGNLFVKNPEQLGDCATSRSLYLIDMEVEDGILSRWLAIMLLMFVFSRVITYFIVRLVIKIRRNKRAD